MKPDIDAATRMVIQGEVIKVIEDVILDPSKKENHGDDDATTTTTSLPTPSLTRRALEVVVTPLGLENNISNSNNKQILMGVGIGLFYTLIT